MSNSPDEIRANIEATRGDLSSDVDALADKVTPSKIVHRNTDRLMGAVGSARDRVMGAASDAKDRVGDLTDDLKGRASDASGSLSDVSGAAVQKAQGNPLAVGLIAFGIGWLAASLVPPTRTEQHLAAQAKEQAQPLIQDMTEQAKESAQHLKEPAREAAEAVRDTATDAVQQVKSETQDAAGDLKDQAQSAADETRGQVG